MAIEKQEQLDKVKQCLKDYEAAIHLVNKANVVAQDKLSALKNATGLSGNNGPQILDDVLKMVGRAEVYGLPEVR